MRFILIPILLSNLLFSVGGVIIFNDGTTIEGDVTGVNESSIYITPMGLTFPEEIRMENVDSLKLYDGKLLVANNRPLLLYDNGQFYEPGINLENNNEFDSDYDVEYVIVPNWSLNLYTGYPLIRASSFEEFDKSNVLWGLSIGSPYGIFAGDFFMNAIVEFVYYNFQQSNDLDGQNFGGPAFQIGLSPGLFIGEASISLTACTGIYQNDKGKMTSGFIAGGSLDIPLGNILDDYIDIDADEFPIELRITSRSNLINKDEGITGWLDAGISIGYEF
tara:strand:+ start:1266 stop:2093 length:828 start_codon:yes stop_codon:yes gene_type:complete